MSVAATYAALVTLVAASSGIAKCTSAVPSKLDDLDLPRAIVRAAEAEWNEHAQDLRRQKRYYIISVFVKAVAQGKPVDEGYQACLAPLNALGVSLLSDPTLGNTIDHFGDYGEFTDGGVTVLEYAGIAYHGFEFRVATTEKAT